MKKLLLFLVAAVVLAIYFNYRYESVPGFALEKKIIVNETEEKKEAEHPLLKVMTYNIHRGINKSNELDLDGIAGIIRSAGPDVVALQEVERFSVRTRFQDQVEYLAEKLSMNYAYGKSISILNGQYGNAILSRYPIDEYEVNDLPSEGEKRTLLRVILNVNGSKVPIYNTHLGLKKSERDRQISKIMGVSADERRYILTGDFNSTVDKLQAVTEKLIDSAAYGEDEQEKPTFADEGVAERIDYIFTSKDFGIKKYEVLESEASDHYPVMSTLKILN